jgi:hypothetical protein
MHHETSLRRTIEEKDRLLQAKEMERVAQLDRYKKYTEDLFDQLIHIDQIKEETLKNLAAAQVKPIPVNKSAVDLMNRSSRLIQLL